MSTYEQIRKDYEANKKHTNKAIISAFRVIIGELERLKDTKEPDDKRVLGILRALHKSEKEVIGLKNETTSEFCEILENYLPVLMSETEIKTFILENFDLGSINNSMQLMRPIMKELKGKADGSLVKKILENNNNV